MPRGVIELTTTAIVTIVVAAVVLVLLIVFIGTSFTATSQKFMGQTESYSAPPVANEGAPIMTAALGTLSPGSEFTVRVSVFNTGASAASVALTMTCAQPILSGPLISSQRDIDARGSVLYAAVGTVAADARLGGTPCTLRAVADGGAGRVLAETDLVLTVR